MGVMLHNPLAQSRLCPALGETLEAHEVREVPKDFEKCEACQCVVFDDAAPVDKKADKGTP